MEEHDEDNKDCNCNKCEEYKDNEQVFTLTFINPNLKGVHQRNHIRSIILRNTIVNNDDPLRCIDNIHHFLYSGVFDLDNKIIKEYEEKGMEKFLIDCKPIIDMIEPDKYYEKVHIYGREVLLEYKEARKVFFRLENIDRDSKSTVFERNRCSTVESNINNSRSTNIDSNISNEIKDIKRMIYSNEDSINKIRLDTMNNTLDIYGLLISGTILFLGRIIIG